MGTFDWIPGGVQSLKTLHPALGMLIRAEIRLCWCSRYLKRLRWQQRTGHLAHTLTPEPLPYILARGRGVQSPILLLQVLEAIEVAAEDKVPSLPPVMLTACCMNLDTQHGSCSHPAVCLKHAG